MIRRQPTRRVHALHLLLSVALFVQVLPLSSHAAARTTPAPMAGTVAASSRADTLVPLADPNSCALAPIALHHDMLQGVAPGATLTDIVNGTKAGNFGWLSWTGKQDANTLAASLTPPGDSHIYTNPHDDTDHTVSVGDWIGGSTGVSNSDAVRKALDTLKTVDTTIPVWDATTDTGRTTKYHVVTFAKVRLTTYQLSKDTRISARFVGMTTCGAAEPTPSPTPPATATPTATPTPTSTVPPTATPGASTPPVATPTAAPTATAVPPTATPTPVAQPALTLVVDAPATVTPGTLLTYTAHVTNTGTAPAALATAQFTFPDGTLGQMLITDLAPGAVITDTLSWTVPMPAARGTTESVQVYQDRLRAADGATLQTKAVTTWQDAQGKTVTAPEQAFRTAQHVPVLVFDTQVPTTLAPSEVVTATHTITNTGHAASHGLMVKVTNPDGSVTSATAPALESGKSTMLHTTWVAPAVTKTTTEDDAAYQKRLVEAARPVTFMPALTWTTGTAQPYGPVDTTATANPTTSPVLTVALAGPDTVKAAQPVTYTVTVRNTGQAPAAALNVALIMLDGTVVVPEVGDALAAGAERVFTVPWTAPPTAVGDVFPVRATATWQDAAQRGYGPVAAEIATTFVPPTPVPSTPPTDPATPTPLDGATLLLTPELVGPSVTGMTHTFTATLRSASGTPLGDQPLTLQSTGANAAESTATTNAQGVATFRVGGAQQGEDVVTAVAQAAPQTVRSNRVSVGWMTPVEAIATTTVWGRFFPTRRWDYFVAKPTDTPALSMAFPTINFNPPRGSQQIPR